MHYKNGRDAKVGDTVIQIENGKPIMLALLVEANAGSTTCNGRVIPKPVLNSQYVTIGDCYHVDDMIGLHPAPSAPQV